MLSHTILPTGAQCEFGCERDYLQVGTFRRPTPAVLLVHGWKSSVWSSTYTQLAQSLREVGYHTMQLQLRGHEGTPGDLASLTREDHAQDILAACAYLKSRPEVDSSNICAFGASYGAYLLASSAGRFNPKLLALRAPALYPRGEWASDPAVALVDHSERDMWRKQVRAVEESHALAGLAGYFGDLLIVSSERDEYLPAEVTESYQRAALSSSKILVTLEGAAHSLSDEHREKFIDVTTRWFKERHPARKHTALAA